MKIKVFLISTFLCWAAYDLNLFRRRRDSIVSITIEFSQYEAEELRQQKKILRNRHDVIPLWHRGRKKPLQSRCNYFSTKPRDVRFSDQKKLRRMFNNM